MAGVAGRLPVAEQAASVADTIRARASLDVFMVISVGFWGASPGYTEIGPPLFRSVPEIP
jgi:hypothetical protein